MQANIEKSCVAISPTQPTTNESVWIKKGKNELNTVDLQVQTINGVTITRNSDGTIKLDGTATASGGVVLLSGINKKLSGKYTFSLKVISGSMTGNSTRFSINNSSSSSATNTTARLFSNVLNAGGTSASNTAEISDTMYYLTAYINNGCVFNNCVIALQVEQGPTATAYEQFIEEKILIKNNAGQFEEYSDVVVSAVQPAQGKVWFKKGNNLYNKNAISAGAYLDTAGEVLSNANYGITDYMEVNSNEYYRYSGITDIDETYAAKACLYDSSKTFLSYINIKKTGDVVLIPSNAKYIRFSIKTSDGGENTFVFENNEKEIYVKNDNGVFEKFYSENEMNKQNYSTSEQSIGTWIDGKTIYRKVIKLNALPSSGNLDTDISYLNIDRLIEQKVIIKSSGYQFQLPIVGNNYVNSYYNASSKTLNIQVSSDRSTFTDNYAILEYTKSTD